jgi:benzoyl-CoA reductase subunit C
VWRRYPGQKRFWNEFRARTGLRALPAMALSPHPVNTQTQRSFLMSDALSTFSEIIDHPFSYAASWKAETGGPVVGYFCSYAPEEIIHAAGALPFRIFGTDEGISRADAHLQSYSCSLVRGALEDVLAGRLAFLDGTVFPHTCDSIQRLSDIWRLNAGVGFHIDAVLPVKLNTPGARQYMADVLQAFRRDLGKALGTDISDEKLVASIGVYNEIRQWLERLYRLRRSHPAAVSSSDVHTIVKAAMLMDRARFLDMLPDAVQHLEQQVTGSTVPGKKLVLAGGVCSMPDIYQIIASAGGSVVWDDLCTGARFFEKAISGDGPPLEAIADRYLDRTVCPAKHGGLRNRGQQLLHIVRETGADGVVFLLLKFCDPHSFDYPYIREMLDAAGIPSLHFEIEDRMPAEGQFQTRVQAFLEMI